MVLNEDAGLLSGLRWALAFAGLAFVDHDLGGSATLHIGPGIKRIVQDIVDKADARQLPHPLKLTADRFVDRQFDALLVKPAVSFCALSVKFMIFSPLGFA
jgi:hypothetical protein